MNNFRRLLLFVARAALPVGLAGFAAVMTTACAGRVFRQAQSVVVTGIPSKVEHCQAVGTVQDDRRGDGFDDRMLALKEAAVVRGGNTVLVRSPAISEDGTAYVCQPPIKPDDAP